jgi:hypothetical protein
MALYPLQEFVITCEKAHATYLFARACYPTMVSCFIWGLLNKLVLEFSLRLLPS